MESFIVRIYRRGRSGTDDVAGLVETVGSDEKAAFQSFAGLISAIRRAIGCGADKSKSINVKSGSYQEMASDVKKRAG